MKILLIFLILLSAYCTNSFEDQKNKNYDNVVIYYRGFSPDYISKEEIVISVTDSIDIAELNRLKSITSKPIFFAGMKGNDYNINIVFKDNTTGKELLVRILKNIELRPTIVYGIGNNLGKKYRNDALVNYVSNIIELDLIEQYNGEITQIEYDKLIE